ncbi:MAG: hypothetical protein J0I84_02120 [Terrimonas sp.]|nr:hypothetical protein [Terrimonas sp.]OJY95362.1 MAG: hypothetical protein BGP13_13815 [Sphingobacteriales bacterium 40-81]
MKCINVKSVVTMGFMAVTLLISASVSAQDKMQHKTPEEKAKMMSDKMKTALTLTDEQYQKVQAINLDFATKSKDIKKDGADRSAWMEKIKPLEEERNTALKGVLTPEQFTKYESLKEEMKGKMKDKQKEKS